MHVIRPTRYCRGCGYILDGLRHHACPECGRVFDPAAPATYLQQPKGAIWKRCVAPILAAALALATSIAIGVAVWMGLASFSPEFQSEAQILVSGALVCNWPGPAPGE